jgi:protein O-GlcNAc transferase
VFAAEEWGFTPVGLDLRRDNVAVLRSLGYEAHCVPIEELDDGVRYSVVSMADVLEHMPFPKSGLLAARRLLAPGGALFLSMPNTDTMLWRLLHANKVNPYWGEIEHYHNFSRRRLYALLEEHGFEPVEYGVSERYRACMEVVALRRCRPAPGVDQDDFGSNRSEIMNVIDSHSSERDADGKALTLFLIPL